MSNETLILILFLIVNILTGACIGLLDSRNYWRKQWEKDEEFILKNIRKEND